MAKKPDITNPCYKEHIFPVPWTSFYRVPLYIPKFMVILAITQSREENCINVVLVLLWLFCLLVRTFICFWLQSEKKNYKKKL